MKKYQRIVLWVVKGAMVLMAAVLTVVAITVPEYTKYGGIVASFLLPFLWDVAGWVLKWKVSFGLQMVYLAFLAASLFIGIDLNVYRTVDGYDKVIHVVSGVLAVVLGVQLLEFFRARQVTGALRVIFLVSFSLALAVLWEFFEFGCDSFLGQQMQELIRPGVEDTMFDLLGALAGTIVGVVVFREKKKSRRRVDS